uniref:L3MBTL histone methyl-lysine binding protein 3 n=1 Tax=Cyprinus carpio carpio TaxID=630221 RepID=A0A9J7YMT4_CYPCA
VMESGPSTEFDVYGAMDWKDGVGTLLSMNLNMTGLLRLIFMMGKKAHATTTWSVPTAQEGKHTTIRSVSQSRDTFCYLRVLCSFSSALSKEQVSKEETSWAQRGLVCVRCNRKGSVVDFLSDGLHCSELKHHSRGATRGRRKRRGDAALLRYTVPYGGKKKAWCWASYLEQERAIAAPSKLFKEYQSFPQCKNGFRVGMRLEGVDPEHPSMYCVLTIAEVLGHRIRLHFDKYSDCYDFWVNSNSPDIHPVGWCEKTGHKLHPPKGMKDEEFSWSSYIKLNKIQTAPKALFQNQNMTVTPSGFRVGMKLEAIDKKNPSFICVATIADMVDSRFLVHFDNWDESYDYWCDATSPYIHPVGWCQENGRTLTTPPGYPEVKNFSWERYLAETNSLPAPARAFKVKPPHSFQHNMKLEVVDKRNPALIRVATVVDTDEHRLRIHFDGWTDEYDYWMDADSPDIHPAGWCAKTGHPLQPPISEYRLISHEHGCPTPGCTGVGHIKGARYSGHHSAVGCPYSDINLNKDSVLPDRLSGEMPGSGVGRPRRAEPDTEISADVEELPQEEEVESEVSSVTETKELTLQQALHQSVFMPCSSPSPSMPHCWDQHSKLLPTVAGITASKVAVWSVDEVIEFIQGLPGCKEQVRTFREEQIDGEAFLLLTQVDLVKILSIKLGPALKIYNSILMFKTTENSACNEL